MKKYNDYKLKPEEYRKMKKQKQRDLVMRRKNKAKGLRKGQIV